MDGLINQPWENFVVRRQLASERDVPARELASLLAQQNARGDAGLAPAAVIARLGSLRHG